MSKNFDLLLAASAPAVWGSTYIVTTEMLPAGYPLTDAVLRALPAGLLLLAATRNLPPRSWYLRLLVLGALNFSIFWAALFIAAQRLPGGAAATLGAVQPLFVLLLARGVLNTPLSVRSLSAACAGMGGVALLLVGPDTQLDVVGTLAALGGALSMALGVVLTRRWKPPVSALTFTAWQLTAGGVLLLPFAIMIEPPLPSLTLDNIVGFVWLGLFGAALSYWLWFRAIARLGPAAVTNLGFLSPLTAVFLGWFILGETLTLIQIFGAVIVLGSIMLSRPGSKRPSDFLKNRKIA